MRDRKVDVVQSLLHSVYRELKPCNPPKHVSVPAMQFHELLKAAEKHMGRTLYKQRPHIAPEVLTSAVRVLEAISVE